MKAMNDNPIVVVGSGPSGLFQALYLAEHGENDVVLVEAQASIGGMFQSVSTPMGMMDSGVFLLEEIGDEKFDALIYECLPAEDWNILTGVRKDIAGNYFEGTLNQGSLYPDIRLLDNEDYIRCLGSLVSSVDSPSLGMNEAENLQVYFCKRFGEHVTEQVLRPIAKKLWNTSLESLSPWAAKVVHLSRFIVAGHEASLDLKKSPLLDEIVGFPDQLSVPADSLSTYPRTLYPKNGLAHLVDAIKEKLDRAGVTILTNTKLEKLNTSDGKIDSINIRSENGYQELQISSLLWTSASNTLLPLLNLSSSPPPDAVIPHRSIYFFLNEPPKTGELYWFWSYDHENSFVRVSSPAAYSPKVREAGTYALGVEAHVDAKSVDNAVCVAKVEDELRATKIIGNDTVVIDSWVNPSVKGYFLPTLKNCQCLSDSITAVNNSRPKNLFLSSQNIGTGDFYLRDVLRKSIDILDKLTTGKAN